MQWVLAGLWAPSVSAQQLTVTLEIVPGDVINGNATVRVEAFIRNDGPDFLIRGIQLDLPCVLPGKPGSAGDDRAQPAEECLADADCPVGAICNASANPNVCNSTFVNNTVNAGTVVVVAADNNAFANSVSSPACASKAIAVAATYDANCPTCEDGFPGFPICTDPKPVTDQRVCFSNRSSMVDVAAPGAVIWSASRAARVWPPGNR